MTSVSRTETVLARWDYLPEKIGLAMSKLETALGEFANKLTLSFERPDRILVRMSARLEAEATARLKAAGVKEQKQLGGRYNSYSFQCGSDRYAVIIDPGKAAEEASSNAKQAAAVDAVDAAARPVDILDNLDVTPPAKKIELEKRSLVRLDQKGEGSDPFDLFEQGLDPAEENPLRVSNESGKLDVDFASFNYVDGERDGDVLTTITCLEFSPTAQRYYVETADDTPGFGFLINVDRENKTARLHMREYKDGAWSGWAEVVDYGA